MNNSIKNQSIGSFCIVCVVKGGLFGIATINFDQNIITNISNILENSISLNDVNEAVDQIMACILKFLLTGAIR